MECAAKSRRSRCVGQAIRRCPRCGAVAYCSLSHQISHWSEHKDECERLEEQMKQADSLNGFPFHFQSEATIQICERQESRCSFLAKRHLHKLGMWLHECSCESSGISLNQSRLVNRWNLPSILCPCSGPISPLSEQLSSWLEYYEWRGIPLDSPVALLLHWPLTIYHAIQLISGSKSSEDFRKINIHYLGPDKELCQLAVFGELRALFPSCQVHIELIGPAVPQYRDGERVVLDQYACCNDVECACKKSKESECRGTVDAKLSAVTLRLHKGLYHDHSTELMKSGLPDLIIAPNAGIAAYESWLPTIELIKRLNVPAVFSDFCEEAAHLAARCVSSIGCDLTLPIQINPYRQPMVVEDSALYLPCYKNCILFGI